MRTGLLALAVLLASLGARAQEPGVCWVTFACEPTDAHVILQVPGSGPFVLGPANQRLALDLSWLEGAGRVVVIFRRPGWLDEPRTLQEAGTRSHYFDTHDRYPEEAVGPVRLAPRRDLASRMIQLRYHLARAWWFLVPLGGGAGLLAAWVGRRLARLNRLQKLRAWLDPADPLIGSRLGAYRLVERLGRGGMAVVYKGVPEDDLDESRAVAIKVMDRDLSTRPDYCKRFTREIRACMALSHPNIIRLVDWGEQEGLLYFVMELLEGETLRQLLPPQGLPWAQAVGYVLPLMEALGHAHGKGFVHRDLKPDNLFVTRKGLVKLMDFGIARAEHLTVATATGVAMGTPGYMAPEQVQGVATPASDQYALGVVLYELLAGRKPFEGDPAQVLMAHLTTAPPSPRARVPEVPQTVERVVLRMLRKQPEHRYAGMTEARRALAQAGSIGAAPIEPITRPQEEEPTLACEQPFAPGAPSE